MFEDYMQNYFNCPRNFYQTQYEDIRENNLYNPYIEYQGYNMRYNPYNFNVNEKENRNLRDLYPDIYNIVEPMIKKVCIKNRNTIDNETLDNMTNEVYNNLETNEGINLNITINNELKPETRSKEINLENRNQNKNNFLKDLIKILILQEMENLNKT